MKESANLAALFGMIFPSTEYRLLNTDLEMFPTIIAQIRRIPRGRVATYGDVAYAAGFPGAARQVAWALHSCPPGLQWHRVIGSEGKILCTGELGFEQRLRLKSEGVRFIGQRVAINEHRFNFFPKKKSKARK